MGYDVSSGNIHVDKHETHFFTYNRKLECRYCQDYSSVSDPDCLNIFYDIFSQSLNKRCDL